MEATLNLLLLEDVGSDAELVEQELRRSGFQLNSRRVESREDFLRELTNSPTDIILADYTLPQFSALEALQLLREARCNIPLLLVTGANSEEVAVRCMQEGAEDYILKSSLKRLPSAVQRTITKFRTDHHRQATEAALRGSSHYDLPPVLRWLTANIGIHHVHHASARIPFYRLHKVLKHNPALREISRLGLWQSIRCAGLTLWDEGNQRLISFSHYARQQRA